MITPNIAPRRIMGSTAAGLFSAAKSSVRAMERTTNAIVKSPDITKDEKLGINYIQFFGSKKNAKILKKSLKTIRDSLVATFSIAKLLKSEITKISKLFGSFTIPEFNIRSSKPKYFFTLYLFVLKFLLILWGINSLLILSK